MCGLKLLIWQSLAWVMFLVFGGQVVVAADRLAGFVVADN
jgi:hypothetical protein